MCRVCKVKVLLAPLYYPNTLVNPVTCLSCFIIYFRVSVEIARGTPHGRDREKWGTGGGDRGGRDRRGGDRGGSRGGDRGGRDRPVWLDKYGPPTRTDFRVIVENLSSRVSWQVNLKSSIGKTSKKALRSIRKIQL